jgi:hypothetical protein
MTDLIRTLSSQGVPDPVHPVERLDSADVVHSSIPFGSNLIHLCSKCGREIARGASVVSLVVDTVLIKHRSRTSATYLPRVRRTLTVYHPECVPSKADRTRIVCAWRDEQEESRQGSSTNA